MKIAVVGSRGWREEELLRQTLSDQMIMCCDYKCTLVSGGAIGVDLMAEKFVDEHLIKKIIFLPDWNKYGKSAGFRRNELIINEAEKVIAFWDGKSKGTKHSIDLAIKAGKPVDIYIRY